MGSVPHILAPSKNMGTLQVSFLFVLYIYVVTFTDTAYTEKYMGLAHSNDNYRGYDVSINVGCFIYSAAPM